MKYQTLFKSQVCSVECKLEGPTALLAVEGVVTEDFTASTLIAQVLHAVPADKSIAMDLAALKRFNSVGVRSWVVFLSQLQQKYKLSFSRIGDVFVEQAVITPSILGNPRMKVQSVSLPYQCTQCKNRWNADFQVSALDENDDSCVTRKCAKCSTPAQPDADVSDYFFCL